MRPLFLALVPAGVGLGVLAYEIQVDSFHSPDERALAQVAVGLAFLLAGLIAWWRRPANRLGALMVAAGFALLLRQLRYSNDALAFTLFFAFGDLGYALVGHAALAYPSGRVQDRVERWLVRVGYATVLAFPLTILLFHDERDRLQAITRRHFLGRTGAAAIGTVALASLLDGRAHADSLTSGLALPRSGPGEL